MQVNEIMNRTVRLVTPDATVRDAAGVLDDAGIGALPVRDGERLVGMITFRDIVTRSVTTNGVDDTTRVGDIMTEGILHCSENEEVENAVELMSAHDVRRLAVLDAEKRLTGIIALSDIATNQRDVDL